LSHELSPFRCPRHVLRVVLAECSEVYLVLGVRATVLVLVRPVKEREVNKERVARDVNHSNAAGLEIV